MKFQILSADNGVGLTRDRWIIQNLLLQNGHQVKFTPWDAVPTQDKYDANIFLELVNQNHFVHAKKNFILPNPEWFQSRWLTPFTIRSTHILAKTHDCQRIFHAHGFKTTYISFTSEDRFDPLIIKTPTFVHLPGRSTAKGTNAVVHAFSKPGMPKLNIYCHHSLNVQSRSPNVIINRGQLDEVHFRAIQNENLFHICPSTYEGFGHYINEAKSTGAVVITTASEPMTDLINPDIGFGVAVAGHSKNHLAVEKLIDTDSLTEIVMVCNEYGLELEAIGKRARESFTTNDLYFRENFLKAVTS